MKNIFIIRFCLNISFRNSNWLRDNSFSFKIFWFPNLLCILYRWQITNNLLVINIYINRCSKLHQIHLQITTLIIIFPFLKKLITNSDGSETVPISLTSLILIFFGNEFLISRIVFIFQWPDSCVYFWCSYFIIKNLNNNSGHRSINWDMRL